MWVYWWSLGAFTFMYLLLIFFIAKWIDKDLTRDGWAWVKKYRMTILGIWVVIFLFGTFKVRTQIFSTASCFYKSWSRNIDTRYDWIGGECQYRGKDGVWLPLYATRNMPEGKDAPIVD